MSKKIVIGIGEILWDVFGEEKRLGGAPANFAHHASQTGAEGVAVSAVGDDALGDAIFAELAGKTLRAEFQRVSGVPTGTVAVSLDASGSARYAFPSDSAWDHLAFTERLRDLAARADAVCFGTLMQRSETSRGTVRAFLRATPENALRVFDANLRADFYSEKLVRESLALANVLKINEDELRVLGGFFGVPASALRRADLRRRRQLHRRARRRIFLRRGGCGNARRRHRRRGRFVHGDVHDGAPRGQAARGGASPRGGRLRVRLLPRGRDAGTSGRAQGAPLSGFSVRTE